MTNKTRANVSLSKAKFPPTGLYNKSRLEIWIIVGRMSIPVLLHGLLSVMNDVNCVDSIQCISNHRPGWGDVGHVGC